MCLRMAKLKHRPGKWVFKSFDEAKQSAGRESESQSGSDMSFTDDR